MKPRRNRTPSRFRTGSPRSPGRRRALCSRFPMSLSLNIGKCTLLGNYRENNEDAIDVKPFPELTVCIVADGMGGQAAGEIASKRAVEVIPREVRKGLAAAPKAD